MKLWQQCWAIRYGLASSAEFSTRWQTFLHLGIILRQVLNKRTQVDKKAKRKVKAGELLWWCACHRWRSRLAKKLAPADLVDSPHKDQAEWGLVEISLYFNPSSFATDYHHPTSLAISILCWSPCRTKLKTTFVKVVTTLPEVVKPVYVYPAPDCDFQTAQYLFTNVTWPPWPTQCFSHIPQRDNTVHSHYVMCRSPPYVALLRFSNVT